MYTTIAKVRNTGGCKSIPQTDVSDDAIEQFIVDAQNVINGTLRSEYDVPFVDGSVPPEIETLCKWGAAYFTMSEYPDKVFEQDLENTRIRFYDMLKQIKAGTLELTGVDRAETSIDIAVTSTTKTDRWT